MKIKFDFGTQNAVPHEIVTSEVSRVINAFNNTHGLKPGKCVVYLTFYDENGLEQIVGTQNGETINYLVRAQEYKRIPKNTEYVGKCSNDPEAHLYIQYE